MNKRIRELAEQTELNATLLFNKEKLEKFALLIVEECESVGDHWVDNLDDGKNLISQRLKQHFGLDS
jgi:hypothetical protein